MKKIITIFALLSLLSCKKEEPLVAKETTTTTVTTYEPKTYFFAQDFTGDAIAKFGVASEPMPANDWQMWRCSDLWEDLTDGVEYRIQFYTKNVEGYYVNLEYEAVVIYTNDTLVINKSGGNKNMYYTDDCGGQKKYTVK